MTIYSVRTSALSGKQAGNTVANTALSGAAIGACVFDKNPFVGAVIGGVLGAYVGKHEPDLANVANLVAPLTLK